MTIKHNSAYLPKDWIEGLKQNFASDAKSGFVVFLLALPLSLGIAKASDFPPLMGLLTAIIGGMVVSFLAGSKLTIKGPAAGLIVIIAGSIEAFGGDETGWHLALGAMFVASILQILFGILKMGKLVDIFPLSAIHGMLAAIGIIIIAKQIPVLLDINPMMTSGKSPFDLLAQVPYDLTHLDPKATLVGVISLAIMMGWKYIKNKYLQMIPAPLLVLLIAIPMELWMDFKHTEPSYALVHIGNLVESIGFNVNFSGFSVNPGIFIKFVIMFALVGTLESLLTVKAIDLQDPYERKSNANKDLIAIGVGNTLSACLGGMPMISEVARSAANVANGAKTRWANFFHGFFLLAFVLLAANIIELIPNAALAAMLITVGIKLASPKEFIHTYQIGKDQLAIFLVTIFFTLYEDLLVGIGAGILLKIIIHLFNGASLRYLFKAAIVVSRERDKVLVAINSSAVFTNFLGIKKQLEELPTGLNVTIDLEQANLIDHSTMASLYAFKRDYQRGGGKVVIHGIEQHKPLSKHELASRKKSINT